jgi:tetratricopeptide (TPR) repeat protein
MRMPRFKPILTLFAAVFFACAPLGQEGSSISRGDQAFAHGDLQEALAEYRLAERQGSDDAETYARIAHTYVALGRIDEAREYYVLALEREPGLADQAVADFSHLARLELSAGDEFGMASAFEIAARFRPGISLDELALPLAQHYSNVGEYGRALPFYQKTLTVLDPDSLPRILFETAVAYDEVGDCESAVIFYEDYRSRLARWRPARSEVDWRLGFCSFELAETRRAEGDDDEALRHLEVLLRVGEPRSHLARGYFEKGEILGYRGDCEAAVEAFMQVPVVDPSGTSPIVARAEERIDQIRFGPMPESGRMGEDATSCFPPDPFEDDVRGPRRRG